MRRSEVEEVREAIPRKKSATRDMNTEEKLTKSKVSELREHGVDGAVGLPVVGQQSVL